MNLAIQGLGLAGMFLSLPALVGFMATRPSRVFKLRPSREAWLVRHRWTLIGSAIVGDVAYGIHLVLKGNLVWAAVFFACDVAATVFMIINARWAQESFDRRQADSAGIFHCSNCRENHHLTAPCFQAMARQNGLEIVEIEKIEEGK